MRCPECHSENLAEDTICRQCGAELVVSKGLVPFQTALPAVLHNSQLPRRVATGVGALAFGLGLEILRRTLIARLAKAPQTAASVAPTLKTIKDVFQPKQEKTPKLPKGYEVRETVVYMERVIRRVD